VLVALVAAHVLGALKHLFIDKDGVFERMRFRAPH
jgi:cytochrome b561